MAGSKLIIWNMALGYLKNRNTIASETEQSFEAKQVRTYYDTVVGRALRDHLWGFAKKQDALALIVDPPSGWGFQYAYPTDCIKADRIFNPLDPKDNSLDRIPFVVAKNPSGPGQVIWTDKAEAEFVYGLEITDTTQWTPDFDDAVALLLGSKLGFSIANNSKRAGELRLLYFESINEAQTNNAREGTKNLDQGASWTRARA